MLIARFNLLYSLAMRDIEHEFSLIRTDRRVVPSGRLWNPAADVYKTAQGWIVKVDLAGVCSDELEIESDGNHLQPFREVHSVSGAH
jgi:HSP20 family molecular chaperone IbpA